MSKIDELKRKLKGANQKDLMWAGICAVGAVGMFVYFITLMF